MQFELEKTLKRRIHWATHPNKCIEVQNGITQNGNLVGLGDCMSGDVNQEFYAPDGLPGDIRWAAHPFKCLDVRGGPMKGRHVQIWDCTEGNENQKFNLPQSEEQKYLATPSLFCLALMLPYGTEM